METEGAAKAVAENLSSTLIASGSVCPERINVLKRNNIDDNILYMGLLYSSLFKICSKIVISDTSTSLALLPSNGPTIPAASSWSIILPARL